MYPVPAKYPANPTSTGNIGQYTLIEIFITKENLLSNQGCILFRIPLHGGGGGIFKVILEEKQFSSGMIELEREKENKSLGGIIWEKKIEKRGKENWRNKKKVYVFKYWEVFHHHKIGA